MIMQISNDRFAICMECHTTYPSSEVHACARAFIAECNSLYCQGRVVELDHYLNCVNCGDKGILSGVRPKFTHGSTVSDYKRNELDEKESRHSFIADSMRQVRVWWRTLLNRTFNFNKQLGTSGDRFLPKFRIKDRSWN